MSDSERCNNLIEYIKNNEEFEVQDKEEYIKMLQKFFSAEKTLEKAKQFVSTYWPDETEQGGTSYDR